MQKAETMGQMKATVMKMCGTAFLWASLAALNYSPAPGGGAMGAVVAGLGFAAFCVGLGLFADGFKRDIIGHLRRGEPEQRVR